MWVPGHSNICGNEIADELAREGSERTYSEEEPCLGIALQTAKSAIFEWLIDETTRYWEFEERRLSEHVNRFVPYRSLTRTKELINMNITQVRVVVAFLTGHARLNKLMSRMGYRNSSDCRICHSAEETAKHILCDCPYLEHKRMLLLGSTNGILEPEEFREFSLKEIFSFLKRVSTVKEEYGTG
ncbi:uncharacterized protein LOC134837407 [Culicoides brevitarsis]|uniref:uncharacterized protein LOC134837407 n=1 Tax=Culicoides brevitarsis TaxID=469753 RepID=UPI00307B6C42